MAKVIVTEQYLEDIGDALREKLGTEDTYLPSQMASAISQIHGESTLITKTITENGTYNAEDDDADGYSSVTVNVSGSGGGSTTYVGKTDPISSQGVIGDFYIKYMRYSDLIAETTTRNYTLNITGGLRGSSVLNYVGAQEIQLFYDDGEGNEVNIRTLANFTYSCNRGYNPSSAFDGNTSGNYWEANPTPVIVYFSATVPAGYTLKRFVVWQRQGSYTTDVWSDFDLTETIVGASFKLLDESELTVSDWAGAGYGTEWDLSNVPESDIAIVSTYAKIGETEQSAQWIEHPIEVTIII